MAAPAWAAVLGQTLRDALAFDRPGRILQRDPYTGAITGAIGARAPLPAVDPALAAAFPGRSPRELLGALERGRGALYERLREYGRAAPRAPLPAGPGPRPGPGARLGAAGLWDCERTRPVYYRCIADGARLQRSPWGRLPVNPLPRGFGPTLRRLIRGGLRPRDAMRETWRRLRGNPGAAWHKAEATRARGEWHKAPLGSRRQTYFAGIRDTQDYSAEVSARRGMNPGAAWHGREATAAEGARFGSEERGRVLGAHYYRGKRDAHRESQAESRRLGLNPQVAFDPFDYDSPAAAKRARDAKYRELRARGIPARRSVLHGQLEKYRGLGIGGRGVRDIYYLTWADPAPPGSPVEVPWPRGNPWAAWHEARREQYGRLARAAPRGSRRRAELRAAALAHAESARASRGLGGEPPRTPGGRRPYPTGVNVARPSAIPGDKLAAASRYLNLIRNRGKRAYGFAYLSWLKGGAVGYPPERPPGLSVMGAQAVRLQLEGMDLWGNPRASSRARFCPEQVAPKGRFDRRSFRTVVSDGHRVTVGCPKGRWDPRRKRCKVGTQAQRILHPEGEGACPLPGRKVRRRRGNPEYRVTAFGERERGRGKRRRREGYGYQVLGPYESPTRLPGTGSFYFPHLQAAKYHAAREFLDPAIHQVKLETAQGREVARYFRRRRRGNPPAGPVEIYRRVEFIGATKGPEGRYAGERFLHRFRTPARILGLPDGNLLIQAARGR